MSEQRQAVVSVESVTALERQVQQAVVERVVVGLLLLDYSVPISISAHLYQSHRELSIRVQVFYRIGAGPVVGRWRTPHLYHRLVTS